MAKLQEKQRARLTLLLSALGLCVWIIVARWGGLTSDRLWWDEVHVLLSTNGGLRYEPPQQFFARDLPSATLSTVLNRNDGYPPLTNIVVFLASPLRDPILAVRWVMVGLTMMCAVVMLQVGRTVQPRGALLAALLSFSTAALVFTGVDVKWASLAPVVTTLCALSLLRALSSGERWAWLLYAAFATLSLHTHYFLLSLLPAHGLYVATQGRENLRRWIGWALVIMALSAPWYLWGLPQQLKFVERLWTELDVSSHDSIYKQALTPSVWLVSMSFDILVALGFQPSGVRSVVIAPLALALMVPILRSMRAANASIRAMVSLGWIQLLVALAAQSIYSARHGHTVFLTWVYFTAWYPLILLGLALSSMGGGRASRAAVFVLFVWTVLQSFLIWGPPNEARYQASLDNRRELADRAAHWNIASSAIVHRTGIEALLFNLYYSGPLPQRICGEACPKESLTGLSSLMVISASSQAELLLGTGWRKKGGDVLGRSRVAEYERIDPINE
jgi:hypothetical protein